MRSSGQAGTSRPGLALVLAVMGVLGLATSATAQDRSGLYFVAGLGYQQGGPGPALVEGLQAAGLDGTRRGQCFPTVCVEDVDYPFYFDEGLDIAAFVGGRYRFKGPIALEFLLSNGPRGHAEGFNDATSDHFVVRYSSFLLSNAVQGHLGPALVEAGPVLSYTAWDASRNSSDAGATGDWQIGGIAGVGAELPVRSVRIALRVGGRVFPRTDLRGALGLPLRPDYRSYYVGLTVLPALD